MEVAVAIMRRYRGRMEMVGVVGGVKTRGRGGASRKAKVVGSLGHASIAVKALKW